MCMGSLEQVLSQRVLTSQQQDACLLLPLQLLTGCLSCDLLFLCSPSSLLLLGEWLMVPNELEDYFI